MRYQRAAALGRLRNTALLSFYGFPPPQGNETCNAVPGAALPISAACSVVLLGSSLPRLKSAHKPLLLPHFLVLFPFSVSVSFLPPIPHTCSFTPAEH